MPLSTDAIEDTSDGNPLAMQVSFAGLAILFRIEHDLDVGRSLGRLDGEENRQGT